MPRGWLAQIVNSCCHHVDSAAAAAAGLVEVVEEEQRVVTVVWLPVFGGEACFMDAVGRSVPAGMAVRWWIGDDARCCACRAAAWWTSSL